MKRWMTMLLLLAIALGAGGCASAPVVWPTEPPWSSPITTALDRNHDGDIDAVEIAAASTVLRQLDKNQDGRFTYDEIHSSKERPLNAEPEPAIQALDANQDDLIAAGEIANAAVVLKQLDQDGDGQLSRAEYAPPPPRLPPDPVRPPVNPLPPPRPPTGIGPH